MDIHTLYSDRTLHSGDGRSPNADLFCTFLKIFKRFVLVYYIYIHYSKELRERLLRTSYLAYHKCYTLIVLHASRGLSKLRNKQWLNDLYGEDNASRCRCAPIFLYKDWLVVALINQVDSTRASVMWSAWCLIAGWILIFVGAARQHLDLPDVARAVQLLEDGERLRVVARRLDVSPSVVSRLWRRYQETGEYTRREGQGRSRMTTPGKTVFSSCCLVRIE